MSHRTASTLLTLVVGAATLTAQSPEPKATFLQAVGQFSLALDGAYGDEGLRVRSSLDAMSRALAEWDAVLRKYEAAMAADIRSADPALALKMHLAIGGLYLDRARSTDGLRELAAGDEHGAGRAVGDHHADEFMHRVVRDLVGVPAFALHDVVVVAATELQVDAAVVGAAGRMGADVVDRPAFGAIVIGDAVCIIDHRRQ